MGFLDSLMGMFGGKKGSAPTLPTMPKIETDKDSALGQVQQFADKNSEQVANAVDKVTEMIPGTADDKVGEAAKNLLGVEDTDKNASSSETKT